MMTTFHAKQYLAIHTMVTCAMSGRSVTWGESVIMKGPLVKVRRIYKQPVLAVLPVVCCTLYLEEDSKEN